MEHVRHGGIGVPGEAKQQICGGVRRDVRGVFPFSQVRWRRAAGMCCELELRAVDMEVVGVAGCVADLPDFCGVHGDGVINAAEVHRQAVDSCAVVEVEPARYGGVGLVESLMVDQVVRHLR
jgi:hypothetical protein